MINKLGVEICKDHKAKKRLLKSSLFDIISTVYKTNSINGVSTCIE